MSALLQVTFGLFMASAIVFWAWTFSVKAQGKLHYCELHMRTDYMVPE